MGKLNSTDWRVAPVFDALISKDPSGQLWLEHLLSLPRRDGRGQLVTFGSALGPIEEAAWKSNPSISSGPSKKEKPLPAPAKLLEWLIGNIDTDQSHRSAKDESERGRLRALLGERDPATQAKALELLAKDSRSKSWHILEGPSFPDVFLRTSTSIVVIEGKFTERAPTKKTTWMKLRHQMLRHIDAAWDGRGARSVYGFFIVEDENALGWANAGAETVTPKALEGSLPHRDARERELIANAFLGVTTWESVCDATGPPKDILRRAPEAI